MLMLSSVGCDRQNVGSNDSKAGEVVLFSTDYGLGIINGATNGPDRHAADVDDAYAVTLALQANLDIQGIITTFGNDKARPSAESARRGLSALGYGAANVTVGSEGFLDAAPVTFEPPGAEPGVFCVNAGVERMRSVLDSNPAGVVTLFAIGPFTDIACLQRAYPASFNRLKEIIGLLGSRDGTLVLEGISVVDFNFAMDPTALGLVLEQSTVALTLIMFEVSQLGTLSNEVINSWAQSGTPQQQYYGQATQPHAAYWDAIFAQTDGQALFDAHTVFYFLNRGLYACTDEMVGTAIVGGYPDTSAATTRNFFTVTPEPVPADEGAVDVYTGRVRGCHDFVDRNGVEKFEQAVQTSVKSPLNGAPSTGYRAPEP